MSHPFPRLPLFPYTTLFRSQFMIGNPVPRGNHGVTLDHPAPPGALILDLDAAHPLPTQDLGDPVPGRSEEHTSELQSRGHLVFRLLLENKNMCCALKYV